MDSAPPRACVVAREEMDQDESVARIRFVSPSNGELFALRLILLERPMHSFRSGMNWEGMQYQTWIDTAIAMGLYQDGHEQEKAFDEAVRIRVTPSAVRFFMITLMQHGGNPQRMFEKHQSYMYSDIQTASSSAKKRELVCLLLQISDSHGGILLRDIPFFSNMEQKGARVQTESALSVEHLHYMQSPDRRRRVQEKLHSLNQHQRTFVDEVTHALERIPSGEGQTRSNGKLFFLQGRAGTGKTYTLNILREYAETIGNVVEIAATTGIAATLYKGGRTVHSLLGLGIDDKDSSDGSSSRSSKYGPRSERAKLLRRAALIIIDEASIIERRFFELINVVLQDLRCGRLDENQEDTRPRFGGINIVFAGDYMQLLPVVPSRRWKNDDEDVNGHYVNVSLLDELPWASSLWEHVKFVRFTRQVRQAEDDEFKQLLSSICTGRYNNRNPLPLRSTASLTALYRALWKWYSTGNIADVNLGTMMVCPTNALVNEHNDRALDSFPGEEFTLFSYTSVDPHRSVEGREQNPESSYVVPEMTHRFCPTGVPPHHLKLKIGAPVMVIRNVLHPHIVNGKMFVVKSHTRRCLCVTQIDKDGREGSTYTLNRIKFQFSFHGVSITRKQFPVRLAFSGTVHKSQGQTLDKIVVDLRSPFFSAGQLYVALSQVRRAQDVLLLHNEEDTPRNSGTFHQMPVTVQNPFLPESVRFAEGN